MKFSDGISGAKSTNVKAHVIAQKAVADTQGCRLVCYEAGQHFVGLYGAVNDDTLTNILTSANRDQRMYDRYIEYLNMLKANGVDMSATSVLSARRANGAHGACSNTRTSRSTRRQSIAHSLTG